MTSYLVTYDLTAPNRDYSALIEHFKSYGTYSHALDSTWLIVSDKTTKEVRDTALKHIDSDDKILVVKLAGAAAWRSLRTKTGEWIKKNL